MGKALGNLHRKAEMLILALIKMTEKAVMEDIFGPMNQFMKEIFKMILRMGRED